jgi:tetratricopeptide (TPR) repeat protein
LAQARRLQKQFPDYADSNLLAGDVEMVRRNYGRALSYFEQAASVRFSFDIMVRMHDMQAQLGRGEQMQALLKRFLAANPHNLDAKHMLGLAYLDGGKPELARATLQEVRLRLGENTPLLLADLSLAQLRSGDGDTARITARKAYSILPMNAAVSFALAEALWADEKSRRDALDLYEKAVVLANDNNVYQTRLKEARAQLAG